MANFALEQATESQTRNIEIALSVTSARGGGVWSATRLGCFTRRERPDTRCVGGWVGLRAGLDGCRKLYLAPHRDLSPDLPALSESLYRL